MKILQTIKSLFSVCNVLFSLAGFTGGLLSLAPPYKILLLTLRPARAPCPGFFGHKYWVYAQILGIGHPALLHNSGASLKARPKEKKRE